MVNVSAIIVTRGDVDLQPIWDSLPPEWEQIVWDNGLRVCATFDGKRMVTHRVSDLSVYGRYAAIEFASHDLVYVQDDDVIVSDPQAIVDAWLRGANFSVGSSPRAVDATRMEGPRFSAGREVLVANMPQEFRHDGYTDSCLVGFGACFHRDAPARAFKRFFDWDGWSVIQGMTPREIIAAGTDHQGLPAFARTCDVVFTALTPRVLVDVPKANREFAEDEGRMYRQPGHVEERARMLALAREVRDG